MLVEKKGKKIAVIYLPESGFVIDLTLAEDSKGIFKILGK